MFDKVYCIECDYFVIEKDYERCDAPGNIIDTYLYRNGERKGIPRMMNQYNNCKLYKPCG